VEVATRGCFATAVAGLVDRSPVVYGALAPTKPLNEDTGGAGTSWLGYTKLKPTYREAYKPGDSGRRGWGWGWGWVGGWGLGGGCFLGGLLIYYRGWWLIPKEIVSFVIARGWGACFGACVAAAAARRGLLESVFLSRRGGVARDMRPKKSTGRCGGRGAARASRHRLPFALRRRPEGAN
jgi:hypothetical protein